MSKKQFNQNSADLVLKNGKLLNRLSAISPHNPVILIRASGHGVFVNALALE
jgi:predicted amidohydrolase YtcJ